MEIAAPCLLETNGAAPVRNDARGQERATVEGNGGRGMESVARESNDAAAATQIQETRADGKTCHQVSEATGYRLHPFRIDGSLWVLISFSSSVHPMLSQCRQGRTHFAAVCKKVKKYGLCPLKYCRRCLSNRYNGFFSIINLSLGSRQSSCRR